jgi:RND family efflux transporter MFP subunit
MKAQGSGRGVSAMAIVGGILLGLTGCHDATSAAKPLASVRVAEVQNIRAGDQNRYSANIIPYSQVDLAFKSGGYVTSIRQVKGVDGKTSNIDAGSWVTKGTVLAVVDQQDYRNKLEQANAQLARAQADYDAAKLSFDRTQALYSSKSATKPDYDSANAQLQSATAATASAKAQIDDARIALGYCELRAPFDGWVVERTVDVGSLVGPATKGFSIANTNSVKAVFGVPDISMHQVKQGQHITITTEALPQQFMGRVTSISPAADPKSRVYSVEVTIQNPHNQLKSGMIASLSLGGGPMAAPVTAVPLTAVVLDTRTAAGFAVMLAQGNGDTSTVRLRSVELGEAFGNMIAINKGVAAGDKVVTTGVSLVKDGDVVRVIP